MPISRHGWNYFMRLGNVLRVIENKIVLALKFRSISAYFVAHNPHSWLLDNLGFIVINNMFFVVFNLSVLVLNRNLF